jgi:hypothetical protein
MCGIDFVMAVTHKEAAKADKNVHFDERIHQYLLKQAIQQKGLSKFVRLYLANMM